MSLADKLINYWIKRLFNDGFIFYVLDLTVSTSKYNNNTRINITNLKNQINDFQNYTIGSKAFSDIFNSYFLINNVIYLTIMFNGIL